MNMENEATCPPVVGGSHEFSTTSSPQDARTYFQQVPAAGLNVENLLDASAGIVTQSEPLQSSADTGHHSAAAAAADMVEAGEPAPHHHHHHHLVGLAAGPTAAATTTTGDAEIMQHQQNAHHPDLDWGETIPGPAVSPTPPETRRTSGLGWQSGSDDDQEPTWPWLVNAGGVAESGSGLGRGSNNSSFNWRPWTTDEADPWPPAYDNKLHDYSIMTNAEPPTGSSDAEIIEFVNKQMHTLKQQQAIEVNHSDAEDDELGPTRVGRYLTSLRLSSGCPEDPSGYYGYWKEKDYRAIRKESRRPSPPIGFKRTFQYYENDGTKTSWFANEYIPTGRWGTDQFLEDVNFREIFNSATKAPGEPTSPRVKTKKRKTAVKKHRMRGPNDPRVVKPESAAWRHFIKVYDRHPEQEGSKVVYAVCCYCHTALRAGTENGTKSLLTHCTTTCPSKHLQFAISSG